MAKSKVCVIGSINMDLTVETDKVPAKGETVLGKNFAENPGGKGANQAVAAARLGADVHMIGAVGADTFGETLLSHLQREKVNISGIEKLEGTSTGIANIIVSDNDNRIIVAPGANAFVTPQVVEKYKQWIIDSDVIVMQLEIPIETVIYALNIAAENNIPAIVNPAPFQQLPEVIYEKSAYLTPNEIELKGIEKDVDITSIKEKLIITRGDEGVEYFSGDTKRKVRALSVEVKDTTGAGDTFNGALAMKIAGGAPLEEAILFANAAAAISVTKVGAQGGMPDRKEVENFLMGQRDTR